jgi:hypothetical protein
MRQKLFLITGVAAVVLLLGAVGIGAAGLSDSTSAVPVGSVSDDISGPCDEAEHADDPACNGQPGGPEDHADDDGQGNDVSGPCDEAEHADDPECTGAPDDDSSGPGPGGDHQGEDSSGPNENAGPGNADDDQGDDHGHHGGDDEDDDGSDSGHGGSGPG